MVQNQSEFKYDIDYRFNIRSQHMKINDLDDRNSLRVWVKSVLRTRKMAQQLRVGATKLIPKLDPQNP